MMKWEVLAPRQRELLARKLIWLQMIVSLKTSWVWSMRTKRAQLTPGSPFRRKQTSINTHLFWPLVVFQQHSWVHVEYFCFSSCHQHPLTFFPGFMMKKNTLSPSNLQEEDLICCEWCLAVELATTFSKRPHRLHPSSCHMTCTSCIEGSDVCCRPPAFPWAPPLCTVSEQLPVFCLPEECLI